MNEQEMRKQVIKGLECCQDSDGYTCRNLCPYHDMEQPEDTSDCTGRLAHDALALLKKMEPLTDQDRKDLEILHKVRSGKVFKAGNNDYVIYNGEWYRNNPWSYPQEPVKPVLVAAGPLPHYFECGKCGTQISDGDKFCRMCGRGVRWG